MEWLLRWQREGKYMDMEFTGERYLPGLNEPEISYEHWHRYLFAAEFVKNKVVMDIACGEGYGSYCIAQHAKSVTAIDISQEAIKNASKKYIKQNLHFIIGTVSNIPVGGGKAYDVIISFETIEHVERGKQNQFLDEVKRLLKDDGILIISTPNKHFYTDILKTRNEFHKKEFYIQEFDKYLHLYFNHINIYGQKIYPVSYIWNNENSNKKLREYSLAYSENGFHPSTDSKTMLYIIAVCSDKEIEGDDASIMADLSEKILKSRDQRIVDLDTRLREKERIIFDLDQNLREKDRHIIILEQSVAHFQDVLTSIQTSLFWKLWQQYCRIKNYTLPLETARRKIYSVLINAIKHHIF